MEALIFHGVPWLLQGNDHVNGPAAKVMSLAKNVAS
jgi:hypothetical protein